VDPTRELLLDELARVYARAAVDRYLREQQDVQRRSDAPHAPDAAPSATVESP
jgi:hypothetical protein